MIISKRKKVYIAVFIFIGLSSFVHFKYEINYLLHTIEIGYHRVRKPIIPTYHGVAVDEENLVSDVAEQDIPEQVDLKIDVPILHSRVGPTLHDRYEKDMLHIPTYMENNNLPYDIKWELVKNGGMKIMSQESDNISKPNRQIKMWNDTSSFVKDPGTYEKAVRLNGNFIVFTNVFQNTFAHILMDHLPMIAWLREHVLDQPENADMKLILERTPVMHSVLNWLDPIFAIERVVWVEVDCIVLVDGVFTYQLFTYLVNKKGKAVLTRKLKEGGVVLAMNNFQLFRKQCYFYALRRWVHESKAQVFDIEGNNQSAKYILYLSRNSPTAGHHRAVDPAHEADILQIVRQTMVRHGQ